MIGIASTICYLTLLVGIAQADQPKYTLYLEFQRAIPLEAMGVGVQISQGTADEVVVADSSKSTFYRISHAEKLEPLILQTPGRRFIYPASICLNDRNLWIADPYTHELLVFWNGALLKQFTQRDLPLDKPTEVACAPNGNVFVLDAGGNKSIIEFNLEENKASVSPLKNPPPNMTVSKLAVSADGDKIILDVENQRIFRVDKHNGLQPFRLAGLDQNASPKLTSMEVGPDGLLFFVDSGKPAIYAFQPNGEHESRFVLAEPHLLRPTNISIYQNDLWVVDEGKKAILHFEIRKAATGIEHAILGEEYLAMDHPASAADEFKKASAAGYESAELRLYWGQALYSLHDLDGALAQLTKARSIGGNQKEICFWLGNVYSAKKSYNKAIEQYERVLQADPGHALAHHNLGAVFLQLDEPAKAEKHFLVSLQLDPSYAQAKLDLGRSYLRQHRYGKARGIFSTLDQPEELKRQAQYYIGLSYLYGGKARDSLPYLKGASERGPFFSDSFYALAEAYRALGKRDKAISCFQQVLRIQPQHPEALHALKEMKEK